MPKKPFKGEQIKMGEAIEAQKDYQYVKKAGRVYYQRDHMIFSANEMHAAIQRYAKAYTGKPWH